MTKPVAIDHNLTTINTWANQQFVLSSPDSATQRFIAKQNPLKAGKGVYLARVMLQYYPDNKLPLFFDKLADNDTTNITVLQQAVHVYPNPAKDELNVLISSESVNNYKVELINLLGKIVISKNMNENLYSLSLTGINDGIYICRVSNENGVVLYNDKIVIIK